MAITRADLDQIMTAITNLEQSLQTLKTAATTTEDAANTLAGQGWQSTEAAPTFQRNLSMWQADHQELIRLTNQLIPLLQEAHNDLQTAEQKLTL